MGKKKSFTVSQVLDTHDIRNLPLMSLFISYAYGGLTLESADESSAVISISTTSSAPGLEAQLLLDFRTNAKGKIIAKTGTLQVKDGEGEDTGLPDWTDAATYVFENISFGKGVFELLPQTLWYIGWNAALTLHGGAQPLSVIATEKNDKIFGGDGAEAFFGKEGNDRFHGGAGNDVAVMGRGKDRGFGDDGNDILWVGGGKKTDKLVGGNDGDILGFGEGKHIGIGGHGPDLFVFETDFGSSETNAKSVIKDFDANEDMLVLLNHFSFPGTFTLFEHGDAATLADYKAYRKENGLDHGWLKEKDGDVILKIETHTIILKGTSLADIPLDRIIHSTDDAFTWTQKLIHNGGPQSLVLGQLNGELGQEVIIRHDASDVTAVIELPDETEFEAPVTDDGSVLGYLF